MNGKRRGETDIESEGLTENPSSHFSEDLGIDNSGTMDLDYEAYNPHLDMGDVTISTDLSEIVDSICKDGGFPDSPPDSGSEHLMSPGNNPGVGFNPSGSDFYPRTDFTNMPDLSKVNYTLPMQMIDEDYKSVTVQGGSVMYKDQSDQPQLKRRRSEDPGNKFIVRTTSPQTITSVKSELPLSPDNLVVSPSSSSNLTDIAASSFPFPNSIRFSPFLPEKWSTMTSARIVEVGPPQMTITADKGFNFSPQDEAFIVQKKNHFQVTVDIQLDSLPKFVKRLDGTLQEISYLQVNFYGVKSDIPGTQIKIEQSQADRSKKEFHPVRIDMAKNGTCFQVTVGRLHFAETTSNNMRKKGKPNPAQKYFQLVVALEAIVMSVTGKKTEYEVARMASERVIVRASNPGQFETDSEPPWSREVTSDTVYHMGRVAINTDQGCEALTVNGNIQISGQIMQPSDARIKTVIREVDPREQLKNVNKIKIVQYKYRPEFLNQLPEKDKHRLERQQTGIIAQDVREVIPEAVCTTNGSYALSNGREINNMLIVNKDRLFLENLGAVRELSKVTGHLGDRVEDLEKANESVAVRLSKLRRGGSVKSTSSSITDSDSDPQDFKKRRRTNGAKTLFQNKCVQMVMLCLIGIIAVSMVAMATIYILDYYDRQENLKKNETLIVIEEPTEIVTIPSSSSMVMMTSTTTEKQISREVLVIGQLSECRDSVSEDKCQTFCCAIDSNEVSNDDINDDQAAQSNFINEVPVFIVEPPEERSSTMRSTSTISAIKTSTPSSSTLTTSTRPSTTTTRSLGTPSSTRSSSTDVKKLMELLSAEDPEIHKHNQVLDDLNKPADHIKEEKVDNNVKVVTKDVLLATEKPAGVKIKPTIKTLKKDEVNEVDIEGEQFNEVIDDHITDESDVKSLNGNMTKEELDNQVPQRARRDITLMKNIGESFGNFVTGLVRRIRDTGHNLRSEHHIRRSPIISGSNIPNITLDNNFCDRSLPPAQLNECFQNGHNISLEVPLSKHYPDLSVTLSFDPEDASEIVMCPVNSQTLQTCTDRLLDPDVSAVMEGPIPGTFNVQVGVYTSIEVKFRLPRNVRDRRNLCTFSDNKVGALFEEYNFRFYRVCHV